MTRKILILGGSGEALALARALSTAPGITAILSLAGRTAVPAASPIDVRRGGFGGTAGLARYIAEHKIDLMIDATHPFAAEMKRHAVEAAASAGVPLLAIRRPAWAPQAGDRWIEVDDLAGAAAALGEAPARVFLTTGRKELTPFAAAPQHFYLLRSVDAPEAKRLPPHVDLITARGPFRLEDEFALMRDHRIEIVVSKNSGGAAAAPKLEAARALGLPVVMVRRPVLPEAISVANVTEALDWLAAHHDVTFSA